MTANEVGGGPQDITPEGADIITNHHHAAGGDIDSSRNGHGSNGLRAALESAGGSLKSLTVLAPRNDPFRVDTPAGHRDAQWLVDVIAALPKRQQWWTHGLHYALIGEVTRPNGQPYTNTETDEAWLEHAAKAARWLGYIPFEAIRDKRNAEPICIEWEPPADPRPYVSEPFASLKVDYFLPDADDLAPRAYVTGFTAPAQPYHLALVGEKDSLADALGSVAQRHRADQYWVNGEITDTRAHQMAAAATRTGRPLIVLYFSDCNPAGHQMPISLARKLQGFKAIEFSELQFEVHPVALTAEQVREYGLPSTPLKAGEKRADKWQQAMGVEETEIDALAARRPELLREIAEKAITPFYDRTLAARVRRAEQQWREQAQQVIDGQIGGDVDQLRREAADRLAEIRAEIEQFRDEKRAEIEDLIDTVRVDVDESELPEPLVPEPVIDHDHHPEPLCDSRWDFAEQCRRLIASKAYDSNGSRS